MLDFIDTLDFVQFSAPVVVVLIVSWMIALNAGGTHVRSRDD